ncbi:MAG TPA: universal stress protein [Isosphaeraceae bacterium]|nr:universal stress protein [Isosphaeraceae bacterium]
MTCFRSILVCADFSEGSLGASRVACSLAEESKTQIFLLHVHEPPMAYGEMGVPLPLSRMSDTERETLKRELLETYTPGRPIDVQPIVKEGVVPDEILRAADEVRADLIVLGTHGRSGLRRVLAGSVAESVLRRSTAPVLALHEPMNAPEGRVRIHTILHPTDLSTRAEGALQVARGLARDLGARLILLYVEPVDRLLGGPMSTPAEIRAEKEALLRMRMEADGPDLKCPVETRFEQGDPADEICEAAAEVRADLIVLGCHGRAGLRRLMLGSVAESVLRRATRPVLIVRNRETAVAKVPAEMGASPSNESSRHNSPGSGLD